MENDGSIRAWSNLVGLPVMNPTKGYTFGTVEDFFFKPGTNAINSLLVNRGLQGIRSLPVTAILSYDKDAVIIQNDQAFIARLPGLPTAKELLGYTVTGETGNAVGKVSDILVALNPPLASRVTGFDFMIGNGKQKKRFPANEVLHYRQDTIIVTDQDAKRLR